MARIQEFGCIMCSIALFFQFLTVNNSNHDQSRISKYGIPKTETGKVKHVFENCKKDVNFFNKWIEKGIIDRLSVCFLCVPHYYSFKIFSIAALLNVQNIKAFYMRLNDEGKTVAAMDMLVPQVIRSSMFRYNQMTSFSSHEYASFGLGFERLVKFVTGIDNIQDTMPFPRAPRSAEY
ncbi:aspartyl-tRNA synthetase [Artemisia annua]|uniref:Aspartyl-tRNA synthetase n=1 Tax=Artemisia annua TaxID=35608 RepID=A0A2U1MYL3_ARTAN|nr:aspartyl-tRNA synthetase [Artemisia annua]